MLALKELEAHLLEVASQVPRLKVAEDDTEQVRLEKAERLLQNPKTTATGCFRAAQALCGDQFRGWEPESLWLTLEKKGISIPLINRDKLLAASTITTVPAFWWEVNAFENTSMAFNNIVSDATILQEATPAQLSWAVYEAELLYNYQDHYVDTPSFDREPVIYTAAVLQRAGFILAPTLLKFAQRELDKFNEDGATIKKEELKAAWSKLRQQDLTKQRFNENALDVQLAKLTAVQLYVSHQTIQYENDLSALS